jgi:hypothetical protein
MPGACCQCQIEQRQLTDVRRHLISAYEVKGFWPFGVVVCLYTKRRAARKAKAKYVSICPRDGNHALADQFDKLVAETCRSLRDLIISVRDHRPVVDREPLVLENKLKIVVNERHLR